MNIQVNCISVKHGVIDDNGYQWANLTYLDEEVKRTDTSIEQQTSKVNINTAENNKLAREIMASGLVPGVINLTVKPVIKQQQTFLEIQKFSKVN